MISTLKIIFLLSLTFCFYAADILHTADYQDALLGRTTLRGKNDQESRTIAYRELHSKLDGIPFDLATQADREKFCVIAHTLVTFVSRSRFSRQILEANNRSYIDYLNLSKRISPYMAVADRIHLAAATNRVRLLFNAQFTDSDLQNALLKRTGLSGYSAEEYLSVAYDELHERLATIVSPDDPTPAVTLSEKERDITSRFCNIVRTFIHFVGWDAHANDLLEKNNRSHDYYLELIGLATDYEASAAAKRNLTMGKAKLRLLSLQKRMREEDQDYNTADPDSTERAFIYNLLDRIRGGAKICLLEMANLIVNCAYSPTDDATRDLELAKRIMDEYHTPRKNTISSSSSCTSAALLDTDSDDDSTSAFVNDSDEAEAVILPAVYSVPHIHGDTTQSRTMNAMATRLQKAIFHKQAQLTELQSVLQEGDASAIASAPLVDDTAENPSDLEENQPKSKRVRRRNVILDDSDDEPAIDSNTTKKQQAKRPKKVVTADDEADEEPDQTDSENEASEIHASAHSDTDTDTDTDGDRDGTVKKRVAPLSEQQKAKIFKLRKETTLSYPAIAKEVSCTPIQARKYCAKQGLSGTTKQRTQALHARIKAELGANPSASYRTIAKKVGGGVTRIAVAHYVADHAPEHKKPQAKVKNEKLTKDQKTQIEQLLSADISMEYKDVAAQVGCDSTQVSKYVNRHAPHLKKRTVREYDRRASEDIATSDREIIALIDSDKKIGRTEICERLEISIGQLTAFERRYPEHKYNNRVN